MISMRRFKHCQAPMCRRSSSLEAVKGRADALLVCQDLLTRGSNRLRINTLALAARLPVMHRHENYQRVAAAA